METPAAHQFRSAAIRRADVGTAELAYRTFGDGAPLVFIHGWPLHGFTWRHCLPRLAATRRCIVPDSPGCGETRYRDDHDFSFRGQAETYARFIDQLGLDRLDIVAHDTGATIAREVALILGARVKRLAMINTEVPHHRPPWIRTFQRLAPLPGNRAVFRRLLKSPRFRRSGMGFGGCFTDMSLIDGEFHDAFVRPMIESTEYLAGQIRYLRGIDWKLVDGLATRHREIAARTLLVWGVDDPTFPLERGRELPGQLAHCDGLREVPATKLLPHEEQPDVVVDHLLAWL